MGFDGADVCDQGAIVVALWSGHLCFCIGSVLQIGMGSEYEASCLMPNCLPRFIWVGPPCLVFSVPLSRWHLIL